jgi:hypothetical protein
LRTVLMDGDKGSAQVERLEVVDTGRRRRWSEDEKLKIVLESLQAPRHAAIVVRSHSVPASRTTGPGSPETRPASAAGCQRSVSSARRGCGCLLVRRDRVEVAHHDARSNPKAAALYRSTPSPPDTHHCVPLLQPTRRRKPASSSTAAQSRLRSARGIRRRPNRDCA